jgi:hypothetical protein
MTSFSLAWYAIAGAEKGVDVGVDDLITARTRLVAEPAHSSAAEALAPDQ